MAIACIHPPSRFDYANAIRSIVRTRFPTLQFSCYDPCRDEIPSLSTYDAVIVTGSHAHVYDRTPFIDGLEATTREAIDDAVPLLGVCFGHQLLATVLGATVSALPERAAGYREIQMTSAGERHPLFSDLGGTFTSFLWHRDHVHDVPPDMSVLATNDYGIQAFESTNRPVYGIQFHPEFDREMIRTLHLDPTVGDRDRRNVERTVSERTYRRAADSRRLYSRFVEMHVDVPTQPTE